jgi:hypothetical protein
VCYPNRGSFWDPMRKAWTDPPRQDARPALRPLAWREAGASMIGGCCGTTPEGHRRDRGGARPRLSAASGASPARLERRPVPGTILRSPRNERTRARFS